MNKRFGFLLVGILMLLAFTIFSREIKHGRMTKIDFDTTVRIQDKISSRLDQLMDDGAILADGIVSSAVVLLLTGWSLVSSGKKLRLRAFVIPLAFLILSLVEIYGKTTLPHAGPPFFMVKHPTTIFPKFTMMEPYSYPSGHASRITFLSVIFLFLMWPKLKNRTSQLVTSALVLGYAVFIYVSRIYLGHHWLSDIVGGGLLGSGLAMMLTSVL